MKENTAKTLSYAHSLMERMDNKMTHDGALLLEANIKDYMLSEAREVVDDVTDFFDKLDDISNGNTTPFVTMGYISYADLNYPTVKRINPESNRMKTYNDYETFGKNLGVEGEISGVIKFTTTTFNWRNTQKIKDDYAKYKTNVSDIDLKYGISNSERQSGNYKETANFGNNGIDVYNGANDDLKGHTYSAQNMATAKRKSTYFVIGTDGNILKELNSDELLSYFKDRKLPGVNKLMKMGADQATIDKYINEIKSLKFTYQNFEHSSIVFLSASFDGQKQVIINKNLVKKVKDIDVNPEQFLDIARKKYQETAAEENYY